MMGHARLQCGHLSHARRIPNSIGVNMGEVFRFIPKSGLNVRHAAQRQDMDNAIFEKRTEAADVPPTNVSFGPFCLLPTQFLLLEGDKVVSLGIRALEILIALLERRGELVCKRDLMA